MRRWLGWIAIAWLIVLCAVALLAYGSPPHRLSLDDRARTVAQGLRCPACQGESVADSPAGIAKAMRAEIRRRLARGESPEQIRAYLVSRYTDWILLSPPSSGVGSVAWIAPPLLLVGGLGLLLTLLADWRKAARAPAGSVPGGYLERVRAELSADD